MRFSRILICCSTLALCLCLPAQRARNASGGELIPEQACFDVLHYDLRLTIDPDGRSIDGSLEMKAKATKATKLIVLDLDGALTVELVWCGDKTVDFEHADGRIRIPLPQAVEKDGEVSVKVIYGGNPRVARQPPWRGGFTWSKTKRRTGKPWIATTCQGEGADLWWPCKDHPSDKPEGMDLHITVPSSLYCASNGKLISNKKKGKKRTFHWQVSVPISNYCVALNIAPYKIIKRTYKSVTGEDVPAFFFCLPRNHSKAKKAFPHFLDHVRFMEETCGPYPFRGEKYAVVETPHLGMEHQTIIAYGNGYRLSRDGYDWLHHHEMCHEWWANLVTCRDWKDMWIHEGIGTYMQALYMEKLRGRRGYLREMNSKRMGIRNRAPIAPRKVRNTHEIYFTASGNDIYNKGSWVMHTLRWLMGDEKFFVALRRMAYPDPEMEKVTDGSCVRLTDTEEIRQIAEQHYGKDLGWFFEVYLRQPRLPELVTKREDGKLLLEWRLPANVDVKFPLPVEVEVDDKRVRVEMPDGKGELAVDDDADVRIDPDRLILKEERRRRRR
ncbi:MAG: M1 family metallopeptidase [Planctomycetota bacterium]|jgi:aminopeptidase N